MVRVFFLVVFCGLFFGALCQEKYVSQGLLKATATISPSFMLNRSEQNIYLNGYLEYYVDDHLSLRGETYLFIDGTNSNSDYSQFIHQAMRTYFGAFLHTEKRNWDKYLGLQPGLTLMRPNSSVNSDLKACPSFALHVGTTYYVWKYFHFFADIAYVNSIYRGTSNGSMKTDEIIFSAGLGFQLMTKKN
jgi:hypothetical protein